MDINRREALATTLAVALGFPSEIPAIKLVPPDSSPYWKAFFRYALGISDYVQGFKVKDPGYNEEPFLREIEEIIGIPEQGADDFRRSILAYFGTVVLRGEGMIPTELSDAITKYCDQKNES